jgi:hypothetical protein
MAAVLVTLAQAKAHLRITTPALDPGDVDIQLKLDQAEAIILDYLQDNPAASAWTAATVPGPVTAVILLMLARLYEHRGDADKEDENTWVAINRLLVRLRNPAIA